MAIESISGKGINPAPQPKAVAKNTVDSKEKLDTAVVEDTVSLTTTAQDIKSAAEASSSTPVINETRVAQIKADLQSGRYQINAERIAEKMLQFERKLPDST